MFCYKKLHMDFSTVLLLGVTGLLAGFMSAMVGVGGGIIMVPMLVFVLHMDQKMAQGTSLAVMLIPLSLGVAVWNYHKNGQINWTSAIIIAVFFAVGGFLGSKLVMNIDQNIIKKIFAVLMVVVAVKLFIGK